MEEISFKDLEFIEEKENLSIRLLNLFEFNIPIEELKKIGFEKAEKHKIFFSSKNPERKFNLLILKHLTELKSKISGNKAVYIHSGSDTPLIGTLEFGIIDRNTSIIELRTHTGCNLNCIYCSVDQTRRKTDYIIEKDYLVEELKKVLEYKDEDNIEIHINPQGEPLLYKDLADLISDVSKIKYVKEISIDTNALLLTKEKADELIKAGITRFNISINSIDKNLASKMAGCKYSTENVLEVIKYINKKCDIILAPVWISGLNDSEIEKIIEFSKKLDNKYKVIIGIQNFLNYRYGKNPVKGKSWEEFRKFLERLEQKHNVKLILDFKKDFNIKPTKQLPKPFKKNEVIFAKIVCNGSLGNSKLAVAQDRIITIPNCARSGEVKLKIVGEKHNIFVGKLLG